MACRENNWSLESATFYTEVTEYQNPDEIEERPKSGCYASDILIEGADWEMARSGGGVEGKTRPSDERKPKEEAKNCGATTSLGAGGGAGAGAGCLVRAKLRNSINRLPIIRIIPVEMHKLKLQVRKWSWRVVRTSSSSSLPLWAANKWQIAIIIMARHKFWETVSIKLKGFANEK